MPMNWTPDNDRILLLKLIETHGISVNPDVIAKAWPSDAAHRPTKRAISERFVRLRQMAGLKISVKSNPSTPSKAYVARSFGPKTPRSSAKKRKIESSESDADGHVTEEEEITPLKRKSAGVKAKSGGNDDAIRIKTEVPDNNFAGYAEDPFKDSSPFNVNRQATVVHDFNKGSLVGMGQYSGFADTLSNNAARMQLGGNDVGHQQQQRARLSREASRKASSAWKQADDEGEEKSGDDSVSDFQATVEDDGSDYGYC
ncbi:hypothetical protein P280DRAFT_177914 [Massarina eburnea CBS 473.64]|uniref:Uncharacterized protein n=1 Tax=Massarina eburnea CBS 473.64 TaxID=1395130 RepID=A0A6A6SEP3_9PLEO|nr:hypothetical protein P280DRAFT_177914 [Massarina eburnea CBS 473.64]